MNLGIKKTKLINKLDKWSIQPITDGNEKVKSIFLFVAS